MKHFFSIIIGLAFVSHSCGLKYTQSETREDLAQKRKDVISQYITDSYKDSSVSYIPLLYAQTTLIKPYSYRQLDSLYEVKYNNEKFGKFDKSLEEKIKNQKSIIENSSNKVEYIEHHVYSIQNQSTSFIYYADINFETSDSVKNFTITQAYQFPKDFLSIYKAYITRESIVYPNYAPTENEQKFYDFFESQMNQLPSYKQNDFLKNTLLVLYFARKARSIDTKTILQYLSLYYSELREYNSQTDVFNSINSIWEGDYLIGYEVNFTTPTNTYSYKFSPYFELVSR
ncbi:MAG: hypothetical protein M9916_06645 [Crocinitomicaceae bacterium]|nr:hypothetical protein [Crocinitomicaceae bacterium]